MHMKTYIITLTIEVEDYIDDTVLVDLIHECLDPALDYSLSINSLFWRFILVTMEEFKISRPKFIDIRVSKSKEKEKWIIRVRGVTSGFIVHTSEDDSIIEFSFDAERFEPFIVKECEWTYYLWVSIEGNNWCS